MIQRRVLISGTVQGVGFRAFVMREAQHYPQLCGFVRNLKDGRVEVVFAGREDQVLSMSAKCRQGPAHAHVKALEIVEEPYDPSLNKFQVEI